MDGNDQAALDAAMTELLTRVTGDSRLRAELQRARRTFLGHSEDAAQRAVGSIAERRFLEWFALERESETLGGVPAAMPKYAAAEELTGSMVGAFMITAVSPKWATARDLQDGTMLEFAVPPGSLEAGDLVAGRIFTVGAGRWLPSTAASVFRPGAGLAVAFERDVGALELGRRLQQIELEHALLRPHHTDASAAGRLNGGRLNASRPSPVAPPQSAPLEHLEADLDQLLQNQSKSYSATAISEELSMAERPGQVIGPLLEEIAFETKADIDAVRRLLLEIWNVRHAGDAGFKAEAAGEVESATDGPPGETLGERMVRQLNEGLSKKRSVDEVFSDLEAMAGLEPGAADDAENPYDDEPAAAAATGLPGNLGPLVEEHIWEGQQANDDALQTLRTWVELQGNAAVPHNDLEDVTGDDLVRLLLHIFLSAAPDQRGESVRKAFRALSEFYAWAESTHEMDHGENLKACEGALLNQLDRLSGAALALSTTAPPQREPAMFEIEQIGPKGFGMKDDDGGGYWLDVPDSVTVSLCIGDLLLGALSQAGGFAGPVVVLPSAVRSLME